MGTATDISVARRRRDPEDTYERIIDAAKELIAERGPEALRVSDVAHRAGVNRTTAYQHFRTRDDLVGAVMARVSSEISLMLEDPRLKDHMIDHMTEYYLAHPEVVRLWLYQLLSDIPSANTEGWSRYMKVMQELADDPGTRDGIDPQMLGLILASSMMMWSLSARSAIDGDFDEREAAQRFAKEFKRLLLYGVFKPEDWPEMVESAGRP